MRKRTVSADVMLALGVAAVIGVCLLAGWHVEAAVGPEWKNHGKIVQWVSDNPEFVADWIASKAPNQSTLDDWYDAVIPVPSNEELVVGLQAHRTTLTTVWGYADDHVLVLAVDAEITALGG